MTLKEIIKAALTQNPKAKNKEIFAAISKEKGSPKGVVSGSLIRQIKNELNIPLDPRFTKKLPAIKKERPGKYNPPTRKLLVEALKKHPDWNTKDLSEYVCKRQNRERVVTLSGHDFLYARNQVSNTPPEKEAPGTNRKYSKSVIYKTLFVWEGKIPDEAKGFVNKMLSAMNQSGLNTEIIERINPDIIEVRQSVRK